MFKYVLFAQIIKPVEQFPAFGRLKFWELFEDIGLGHNNSNSLTGSCLTFKNRGYAVAGRAFTENNGSAIHVPLHCGHFDGRLSLSGPNSKPQRRHSAGSTTKSYSLCLRLFSRWVSASVTSFGDSPTARAIWLSDMGLSNNSGMRSRLNTRKCWHERPNNSNPGKRHYGASRRRARRSKARP